MTQDKYAYIYNKVKDALETDKLFLRPELSLSLLSRVVGTNTVYLSKAINNGFGCSYSQLINRYRIEYLIKEAQRTGENIAAIATRCQFWSRSTFFDVFRNQTGMTPHRYMEKIRSTLEHGDGDRPVFRGLITNKEDESKEIRSLTIKN